MAAVTSCESALTIFAYSKKIRYGRELEVRIDGISWNRPFAAAVLERKSRTGTRQTKKIAISNYVCLLFVLSQCDFCSPAWRFCTT